MIASSDGVRLVGYARVSTQDQDLALQIDALLKYVVVKDLIFTDKASGASHQRRGLETCLTKLRDGDVLLVWRLDRLGRSMRHLVTLIDQLRERNIGFRSVCDGSQLIDGRQIGLKGSASNEGFSTQFPARTVED